MELNQIFYETNYTQAYDYAMANNYTIKEIEADEQGRRFQIVEIPQPTQKELAEIEINALKNWFNGYYTEHEQKYRRLYTMKLYCDDGTHPYDKLTELYQTAEKNRKRIQELESQYGIE